MDESWEGKPLQVGVGITSPVAHMRKSVTPFWEKSDRFPEVAAARLFLAS
jgi:hypothetical protein